LPYVNISSYITVDNMEKGTDGKYANKPVIIVARLKGHAGANTEEQGVKIYLSSYTEDKSKSPSEMVPASYSEQDLKVMLLPDFIKSLAGIGRSDGQSQPQVDANAVVADYVSSRVQAFLFRGLERQIEQKLGLENLILDYNLGPKMKEAMGVKDVKGFEYQKPTLSVGFVKGFFDRLYIDMRYVQGMNQVLGKSAMVSSFNYQLTYKITSICSIMYYSEPSNLTEISPGYQKLTLQFGMPFWADKKQ